jgi:hypothetical protein
LEVVAEHIEVVVEVVEEFEYWDHDRSMASAAAELQQEEEVTQQEQ